MAFNPGTTPLKRRRDLYFPILVTLVDLAAVSLGLLLAYWLRFRVISRVAFLPATGGHLPSDYLRLFPVALFVVMVSFSFVHLYRCNEKIWSWAQARRLVRGTLLSVALFVTILFFVRSLTQRPPARWMIPISMLTVPCLVALGRYAIQKKLARSRKTGQGLARSLVIGVGPTAKEVARSVRRHPEFGWTVVGFISADPSDVGRKLTGLRVKDSLDGLGGVLDREGIEAVFVAQPDFRRELLGKAFAECQKRMVEVKIVPDVTELLFSHVSIEEVDGLPILGLRSTPLQGWHVILKRGFDLFGSGLLLLLFAPVMLLLAALVKRDSSGPVFYRQQRVGADGRHFWLIKFRTMLVDAEKQTGPVFSTPDDPRQTRIGRLLRQTHLDELPQLLNVLKGEMSLVGPRPERPFFVEQFRAEIPWYMARHRIKSGMTGWAQVSGQTGYEGTISERLRHDLVYIENWSVLFDLKVLFLTLFWLSRRVRQLTTLPPDHPSLRRSPEIPENAEPVSLEPEEEKRAS
ncbi:sugar transferase [bacterium]|nr:sugar transferase [bacterium]